MFTVLQQLRLHLLKDAFQASVIQQTPLSQQAACYV